MRSPAISAPHRAAFNTAWGEAGLAWTKRGACLLVLPGLPRSEIAARMVAEFPESVSGDPREVADVISQVRAYFRGEVVRFRARLDLVWATPFQRSVYESLMRIPYGETRSYGQVAREVRRPGGARAVGRANALNRIPLIIPCHRVVRSDGSWGGFSGPGGVQMKKRLVNLEKQGFFSSTMNPPEKL